MPTWAWVLIGVAAFVLLAAFAVAGAMRRRTGRLRERFGPEYERSVQRRGGRRGAEAELGARVERREQLAIRPLPLAASNQYRDAWTKLQARFVDDPAGAVGAADELVGSVMSERGYPMGDFEQRAADISVDHPQVVERYRSAHGIARKSQAGEATTEDLRQALKHYGALFDDLLEPAADEPTAREAAETTPAQADEKAVRR